MRITTAGKPGPIEMGLDTWQGWHFRFAMESGAKDALLLAPSPTGYWAGDVEGPGAVGLSNDVAVALPGARWARIVAVSKLRSHLTYANVGVTLALVLATTGFAVASIPGRAGVVSACYQRTSGSLRVIDSAKRGSVGKCRKSEKPLSWNQQGPQGLQGGRGVQGLPGVQGVQGSTGLNGGQGVKGDTGAPGPPASRIDGEVLGPVSRQVLSVAGLTLTASCTPISKPASITINAATDANGARFEINSLRTVDGATPPTPLQSGWVLSTAAPTPVFTDAFTNTTDSVMDGGGTFVYHKSSETVTGTFHYFLQNGGGECDLQGNAVPSP